VEPELTSVPAPLQIRIADGLRLKIKRGELKPGASLPTLQEPAQTVGVFTQPGPLGDRAAQATGSHHWWTGQGPGGMHPAPAGDQVFRSAPGGVRTWC